MIHIREPLKIQKSPSPFGRRLMRGLKSIIYTPHPRRLSENREPTAENPFWPDFPLIFVK
jgi:hypothetical protein